MGRTLSKHGDVIGAFIPMYSPPGQIGLESSQYFIIICLFLSA